MSLKLYSSKTRRIISRQFLSSSSARIHRSSPRGLNRDLWLPIYRTFSKAKKMRNIGAYLLLQAGGNQNPTAADIKKLLGVVGIEADDDRLKLLLSELSGKSIDELIAQGSSKLASVPAGGGGGGGGGAPVAAGGAPADEKKEEEKEEEKEESDEDMGFGLFD